MITKPISVSIGGRYFASCRAAARYYNVEDRYISRAQADGRAEAYVAQVLIRRYEKDSAHIDDLREAQIIIAAMINQHEIHVRTAA